MSEMKYVKVTNNCEDTVEVYIRRPRPKKESSSMKAGPAKYTLRPHEATPPFAENLLIGARGWDSLRTRECIEIAEVPYEWRFGQLVNTSQRPVRIDIAPGIRAGRPGRTSVIVDPRKSSRVIDLKSVAQRRKLNRLVQERKILLEPHYRIGPTTGRKGAVGSYVGESVYTCYECGGPIIFRGHPPTPIHI